MEIVVLFCKGKVDNVIDVLIRDLTNGQEDMSITLAYVQNRIIDALVKVCAQPNGIQGIKLIESVIRPETLHDPSMARNREDQCIEMNFLKQTLRQHLEQGSIIPQNHVADKSDSVNSFISLMGYENYMEEVSTYHELLGDFRDELDELQVQVHDEVNKSKTMRFDSKKEHNKTEFPGDEISLVGGDTRHIMEMVKLIYKEMQDVKVIALANHAGIRKLNDKVDEMSQKIDEIHEGIVALRSDVVSKIETIVEKLSKFHLDDEVGSNLLPRFILLTADGIGKTRKLVTHLSRYHSSSVRMELLCEGFRDSKGKTSIDGKHPHRVEEQLGITIDCQSEKLQKAIPYINIVLRVLTIAAMVGVNILAPSAANVLPNWVPQLNVAKNYPFISTAAATLRPERSLSTVSSMPRTKISESSFEEWQKWLADILADKGGATEENIAKKFRLKRAIHRKADGSCDHIAWVCEKHYRAERPF